MNERIPERERALDIRELADKSVLADDAVFDHRAGFDKHPVFDDHIGTDDGTRADIDVLADPAWPVDRGPSGNMRVQPGSDISREVEHADTIGSLCLGDPLQQRSKPLLVAGEKG